MTSLVRKTITQLVAQVVVDCRRPENRHDRCTSHAVMQAPLLPRKSRLATGSLAAISYHWGLGGAIDFWRERAWALFLWYRNPHRSKSSTYPVGTRSAPIILWPERRVVCFYERGSVSKGSPIVWIVFGRRVYLNMRISLELPFQWDSIECLWLVLTSGRIDMYSSCTP